MKTVKMDRTVTQTGVAVSFCQKYINVRKWTNMSSIYMDSRISHIRKIKKTIGVNCSMIY